jgi:hypothetical protein
MQASTSVELAVLQLRLARRARDSQHRQRRSGSKFARTKSAWKSLAGDRGCLFEADAFDKRVSMPLHQRQRPRRDGVRLIELPVGCVARKLKLEPDAGDSFTVHVMDN